MNAEHSSPFFSPKDIALTTMTPEQEKAAQQGWCMKCAQPSLSEKHRDAGTRWLQCSRCRTVYALTESQSTADARDGEGLPEFPFKSAQAYAKEHEGLPPMPERILMFAEGEDLEAIRSYALAAVEAERNRCIRLVLAEHLEDPTDSDEDTAYDSAVDHCAAAIRQPKP